MEGELGASDPMAVNDSCVLSRWLDLLLVKLLLLLLLLAKLLFVIDELHAVLAGPLLKLAFQSRIVVVLNVVIRAAGQLLGDLRPTIAKDLVQLKDGLVFMRCPLDFFDVRIEMIVPPKIMNERC